MHEAERLRPRPQEQPKSVLAMAFRVNRREAALRSAPGKAGDVTIDVLRRMKGKGKGSD
jgi:hypothetical protein